MTQENVLSVSPLGFPWKTADPFLFCVHHDDAYPAGDARMAPATPLSGRNIGMDFSGKDGWSMYHGDSVPGFPQHPHRGFETITIARRGFIDHSDSMGATARFGQGDVQWMTAGKGVVHSEMFPLINQDAPNPTELFQIWLNLPRANKFEDAHFTMLWHETIPRETFRDTAGLTTDLTVIAGALGSMCRRLRRRGPGPLKRALTWPSGRSRWRPAPGGPRRPRRRAQTACSMCLSATPRSRDATLQRVTPPRSGPAPRSRSPLVTQRPRSSCSKAAPLESPSFSTAPFVMNSPQEIRQAMMDYHQTGFGGWPWPASGPVHPRDKGRFAIHADGREETAPTRR